MYQDLSLIIVIGDRSGSMSSTIDDALGGFNEFVANQKKLPGKGLFTLALFDDKYELVYDMVDLETVPVVTRDTWSPRGRTRLLDALGCTITSTGEQLALMPEHERPGKVICVVVTDGHENDSREYNDKSAIMKMINHQRDKYSWEFVYLGAEENALDEAQSIGIPIATRFNNTAKGHKSAYKGIEYAVSGLRCAQFVSQAELEAIATSDEQTI